MGKATHINKTIEKKARNGQQEVRHFDEKVHCLFAAISFSTICSSSDHLKYGRSLSAYTWRARPHG